MFFMGGRLVLKWLISVVINTVVLISIAGFFKESFYIADVQTALLASVILSFLNVIVKPLLILITLPVTILTMGLFLIVINGFTLTIAANMIGDNFNIDTFGTAMITSIILSILNYGLSEVFLKPFTDRN